MFDFFIRSSIVNSAQRFIDRLTPEVNVHIPKDLPLPSIGIIKRMSAVVSQVNGLEEKVRKLSDEQLRLATEQFKQKIRESIKSNEEEVKKINSLYIASFSQDEKESLSLDLNRAKEDLRRVRENTLREILPEAFAVVREAGRRKLNMRHFDIQLIGGMVLHEGKITEMATGEGKTLVATLAAYLNALAGKGVHVVTVNDYLAKRDREWMGPLYEMLGLTVGVIQHDMDSRQRQQAYGCDITYGTNNEFGFDYLRDNMVNYKEEMVQPGHHFAIVDEVDSILVDEARTPLIISGPAEESTDKYYRANEIIQKLKGRRVTEKEEIDAKHRGEDLSKGFDYVAEEKAKSISLTEDGELKSAKLFGVATLHDIETTEYRHHILQALRAREFFRLDVDYVVRDGKVVIVDEFTGRMMPGRRWSDGLHQAVEAKEGIKIERENQTLATITFQNYFRMYEKLSGMTGTAYTEANEFKQIYKLDCIVMPTNRVLSRTNHPDSIYKTEQEKFNAVVEEINTLHIKGRPVLVGTISIERSEYLSSLLKRRGIAHQVLNAKYHELEAHIVAQAGRYKAVTIATNMAGRGTDIVLGGNAEYLARSLAEEKSKEAAEQPAQEDSYQKFLVQFKTQTKEEHEKVIVAGGLHVLGTERHESRRIDNQLRGRSGRQGDPGSSRFYVSLEDDLMRLFGSDRIMNIMNTLGMEEGQVIEHPLVTRAIEIAQKRVETHNFEIRKQLLEYDNVMNKQREVIYRMRRSILDGENIKERILQAIDDAGYNLTLQYLSNEPQDIEGMISALKSQFGFNLQASLDELSTMTKEQLTDFIIEQLKNAYHEKEKEVAPEHLRGLERIILLQTIDSKWKDHLYAMDQLKEGIHYRAFAQRDPLVEYQREGFLMFEQMYASISEEVAQTMFKVQAVAPKEQFKGVFSSLPQQFVHSDFSSLSQQAGQRKAQQQPDQPQPQERQKPAAPQTYHRAGPDVGRNDPCPCGSGKKYKKCCGRNS
ncbi:MAG: preprotein translocase subunit SecA [Candidatus Omnitrophota bacterium]